MDRFWNWRYGNWHWVWSRGAYERQVRRAHTNVPEISTFPLILNMKSPAVVSDYIQNGFYLDVPKSALQARSRQARLTFKTAGETTSSLKLQMVGADTATWGMLHLNSIYINGEHIGGISRISGSAPTRAEFIIPPGLLGRTPYDGVLFEQKRLAKDGGGDAFMFYPFLAITPVQENSHI